jgi:hypothetical protein
MNGESTAPLPVVAPGPGDLLAVSEQILAALEENRALTRLAIAGQLNESALVMSALRLADLQAEYREGIKEIRLAAVANALDDAVAEVIASRLAAVPEPRKSRRQGSHRQRAPGEGQMKLFRVPSLVLVAFAAIRGAARAHRIAAALTAVTLPAGLAAGGAVIIHEATSQSPYGASAGPGGTVPGWHTSATPIPSSSLIARTVTHPKAKRGKGGKVLLYAAQPPYSYPAPVPSSSSASTSASVSTSAAAGDAAIGQLTFTTLDLSNPAVPSVTFTLTATGTAGWVSWRITTDGTDLDFSTPAGSGTHGVLNAGESVVVTVSLASVLDAAQEQAFTVNGNQSVTVSLPQPVPVPSVSVLPTDLPSVLPSI